MKIFNRIRKHLLCFYLITLFFPLTVICSCFDPVATNEDKSIEKLSITYKADNVAFPNPERGWFIFKELKPNHPNNTNNWASDSYLKPYYEKGYRVAKHITLLPTRTEALPQSFLDQLNAEADVYRTNGFKTIYRFTYIWNLDYGKNDASEEMTKQHLEQLKPFLTKNKDIILGIEMGFLGYWGEMHHSNSGHIFPGTVGLSASGKAILEKTLDVVPVDRFVTVRYPKIIFRSSSSYGAYGNNAQLTPQTAYKSTLQSRIGGWYANFGGGSLNDQEMVDNWQQTSSYTPYWSHCDYFETTTENPTDWLNEAKKFHYVTLSNPKDESHTLPIYHKWEDAGTYDQFAKYLGYRYRLIEGSFDGEVKTGNKLNLSLVVRNDGWARPINPRIIEVVFRDKKKGTIYKQKIVPEVDFRLWFPAPGEQKSYELVVVVPANAPKGTYELLLNLPDPEESLKNNPDYSIRLANELVWEAETGFNKLNVEVEIK